MNFHSMKIRLLGLVSRHVMNATMIAIRKAIMVAMMTNDPGVGLQV
jgi:hypothetical protein